MRKVFFAVALAGLAAAHAGCALIAGYDFGKYGERDGEGGGDATSATSASGAGGAGSTMASVSSTSASAGGSPGMTVLYTGSEQPTSLALDADAVYFTASVDAFKTTSKVMRVTKDGASSIKLATEETSPTSVTVDATHAYWFSGATGDGIIKRAAKVGGGASVEVLFDTMDSLGGVVVEGQSLFFTMVLSDTVRKLPTSGGSPAELVAAQSGPGEIAADASGIYWVNRGTLNQSDGAVMRADLDGSNVKTLASGQKFPLRIALDQGHVYWATLDGTAAGIDKAGKTPAFTYVSASSGPPVTGLAADGAHLYYSFNGDVFKVPINSLSAEKLLSDLTSPKDLAVDATSLYVAVVDASAKGMVIKVPK